jgi:hypothetical protein
MTPHDETFRNISLLLARAQAFNSKRRPKFQPLLYAEFTPIFPLSSSSGKFANTAVAKIWLYFSATGISVQSLATPCRYDRLPLHSSVACARFRVQHVIGAQSTTPRDPSTARRKSHSKHFTHMPSGS